MQRQGVLSRHFLKSPTTLRPTHKTIFPVTNSNSTRLQRCETQLQDFLAVTLNGVPVDTLTATVVPGKWSAHEQLAHLARYHQIFLQRIDRILTEQAPEFPRYRAEDDPEWPAWTSSPTRAKLMARLRSLTEDDFDRTGVHSKFGAMSLALWLEFSWCMKRIICMWCCSW